ncbi:hypothetical protein OKA06_07090 [Novosphingobium sp. MW5]|nr:hypothetical protein [Novosphingobium sp. MW5]
MKKYQPHMPAPDSWFDALGELALTSAGSFPDEEARLLRQLYHLVANAPSPAFLAGVVQPDIAQFEASVGIGATESAALSLLGEDAGYMLSRGSGGQHLASVILPGRMEEATAGADSAALAIAGALAIALRDMLPLSANRSDLHGGPHLRLN